MKKTSFNKVLIPMFLVAIVLGILVYSENLKITIINSIPDAYADNDNYHIFNRDESPLNNIDELYSSGKRTYIFVSSSWCSLCQAISSRAKESIKDDPNIVIYEMDLDNNRSLLNEFNINNAPALLNVNSSGIVEIENVRYDNISNMLLSEGR
jgi:thiol-disulfide isomerase/thioredoxin